MATKRLRGQTWHYTIRKSALLPRPVYLSFSSEAEGDKFVARLEGLLDRGIVPPDLIKARSAYGTLTQVIRAYREANPKLPASDDALLDIVIATKGTTKVASLDYAWVEDWVKELRTAGKAPSTIRHRVGALARCLDWLANRAPAVMPVNPARRLKKGYASNNDGEGARSRRLEPGEESRIEALLAGDREKLLLFRMAVQTAMRMRELYTLGWDQLDIEGRTVHLLKTKNGDKRNVPLSSHAQQFLRDHLRDRRAGEARVFPALWDGDLSTKALSITTARLSKQFARVFGKAGARGLRFHDLRHEGTCRLYENTAMSDIEISTVTGHKDLRMLKRYANLRPSHLADKMW